MDNFDMDRSNSKAGEKATITFHVGTTLTYIKRTKIIHPHVSKRRFFGHQSFLWKITHQLFPTPGNKILAQKTANDHI